MSEKVQQKMSEIDRAANEMQRSLEKDYVRSCQRKSFLCGAKCCEDVKASAEEVQSCIENCQRPLMDLQNKLKQELERYQRRIQQCMMACQETAKDTVEVLGESVAKEKFNSCLYKCAEDHLQLLPGIKKRLVDSVPK